MKISDVLLRDPAVNKLLNNGQTRLEAATVAELEYELSTFVCEGQFADGIQRILGAYLGDLGSTNQKCAWASGFYGSGKSHFLKVLAHLWSDTPFANGGTARSLVHAMPDDLRALLRELDVAGKREGGLLAAAGALPSGISDHVRLTILGVLLRGAGLPMQYPQARFCLWLHERGFLEELQKEIQAVGKTWDSELNNLYVSPLIARALLKCEPEFAPNEAEAKKTLRAQFPPQSTDIGTDEFLRIAKQALRFYGRGGRLPCTILLLDEVQQYIGDSNERSVLVSEVAEALSKQMESRVMLVGAGQSALSSSPLLQRLMARFVIQIPLADADVENVTRKVILQKKPSATSAVGNALEKNAGEVSRQLQGTKIGGRVEDRAIAVADYPLLPVRRRFMEACFRQIDATGTKSQLRSQLKIIHDAVAKLSTRDLGAVVPADEFFDQLAPEMVMTGALLRELNERIIALKDGTPAGVLAYRICGVVFLIGKLAREGGADTGVRATKEHVADLLIDDISVDTGKFRESVGACLEELAKRGVLMQVGDEYRLQTREGSEWDADFRGRQAKIGSSETDIQFRRDQLLYAEADRIIRTVKLVQGAAKVSRALSVYRDATPPKPDGVDVPVWLRDQWSAAEKDMSEAARKVGSSDPTVYMFILRQSAEDLKRLIVDAEAAQQTLDARGAPSTDEGREARQSMESRLRKSSEERDRLVRNIVANTKVFQGGGNEMLGLELADKIREAANAALIRLFPRFKEADSGRWEDAIKQAKDGADHPLAPVGHTDATEKHVVCAEILASTWAGKNGTELRKMLTQSPFGWPRDAVDAALIALHRSQHLSATLNGAVLALGTLDQAKIPKAEFRAEQATLGVSDRLKLRGLFPKAGLACKPNEETSKAPEFLLRVIELARAAGGQPPLPASPSTDIIEDLRKLPLGNAQLAGILAKIAEIEQLISASAAQTKVIAQRQPIWGQTERLAEHARGLPAAASALSEVEAIRSGRMLLDPSDPVSAVKAALARELRSAVNGLSDQSNQAHAQAGEILTASAIWASLTETEQQTILAHVGLISPERIDVSSDEKLIATLDRQSLAERRAAADAVAGRVARALERAAQLKEPKVQTIAIERATLRSEIDLDNWLRRQRAAVVAALKSGPVYLG